MLVLGFKWGVDKHSLETPSITTYNPRGRGQLREGTDAERFGGHGGAQDHPSGASHQEHFQGEDDA